LLSRDRNKQPAVISPAKWHFASQLTPGAFSGQGFFRYVACGHVSFAMVSLGVTPPAKVNALCSSF
jgi:hypothetical protein